MNLQVTELKIGNVEPAKIEWNGAEIKASLTIALEDYKNAVVTEDTMTSYKKIMAELNKQAKQIDDFRKTTVKTLNPDIKKFESEAKELTNMIKEARLVVSGQVEFFIEKQREEKRVLVNARIDALDHQFELEPEFRQMIEFKDRYLNSSLTLNKCEEDLKVQFEQALQLQNIKHQKIDMITAIVNTFNSQLEFKFDPKEFDYLLDREILEIQSVVNDKVQSRIASEKAKFEQIEREKQQAIEKAKEDARKQAEAEAEQKRRDAEFRHQEELRQKEVEKNLELQKKNVEIFEAEQVAKVAVKQVEEFIPVSHEGEGNDDPLQELNFSVLETYENIQVIKKYLDSCGFNYHVEEVK